MKVKKAMAVLLTLALLVGMTGCSKSPTAGQDGEKGSEGQTDKISEIKAAGKLVLGTSPDYPPYEFPVSIDGELKIVGMDIAIAEEIAKELGVELEIREMDFESILLALTTDKVDIGISGFNPDDERRKTVDFSDIYFMADYGFLAKAELAATIESEADLDGLTIGVQTGTTMEKAALEIPGTNVKSLNKVPNLLLELNSGKIDVLFAELPVVETHAAADAGLAVAPYYVPDPEGGNAIAFKKGQESFVEFVNGVLTRLAAEGKIEQFLMEARDLEESVAEE